VIPKNEKHIFWKEAKAAAVQFRSPIFIGVAVEAKPMNLKVISGNEKITSRTLL